ncbi:PLP-dependent aminotransferase family protein [Terrilactibacillus sp. S3-3]|nr:PLP-dependent aminotransferase family protein [Terrilactibacillus sp. S3-3]
MFSIMPILSKNSEQPLYMQLFKYFVREITENRIPVGSKLPSKRRLAEHLNLSQNTIDNAYQQLLAEGYIESRPRKGMFVIYQNPHLFSETRQTPRPAPYPFNKKEPARSHCIDFSHGKVDTEHFPYEKVRKYYHRLLTIDSSEFFTNSSFQGSLPLREKIADYLYQSRGVICRAEQIVIGAGTQYLLDQLCRLLSADRKLFAIENPGFHRVYHLLHQNKVPTLGIPRSKWTVDRISEPKPGRHGLCHAIPSISNGHDYVDIQAAGFNPMGTKKRGAFYHRG